MFQSKIEIIFYVTDTNYFFCISERMHAFPSQIIFLTNSPRNEDIKITSFYITICEKRYLSDSVTGRCQWWRRQSLVLLYLLWCPPPSPLDPRLFSYSQSPSIVVANPVFLPLRYPSLAPFHAQTFCSPGLKTITSATSSSTKTLWQIFQSCEMILPLTSKSLSIFRTTKVSSCPSSLLMRSRCRLNIKVEISIGEIWDLVYTACVTTKCFPSDRLRSLLMSSHIAM